MVNVAVQGCNNMLILWLQVMFDGYVSKMKVE